MMLPFAAMALLFASCSDDSDSVQSRHGEGDPIRFSTSIANLTRNSFVEGNFTEFKVSATGNSATYFNALSVTKTLVNNVSTWNSATEQLWPGYALKFYAWAPAAQTGVSVSSTAQTVTDFTPATAVASQTDLITAYNTGSMGSVNLNFKHALSQIEVLATNGKPDEFTVKVLGVKLCRIPSKATMTFQQSTTAYPTWGTPTIPADYILKGTTPVTLTSTAQSIMFGDNCFQLIPQTLTPWNSGILADGAYLSILCQITKVSDSSQLYPDASGKYGFSAVAINTPWIPGHKYIYTVNFFKGDNGGAGRIDPTPTNPENGDDDTVDPTPGGEGGQGGDPVIGGPITFTVSITDWISEDGDHKDIDL